MLESNLWWVGNRTGADLALFILVAVALPIISFINGGRIGKNPAASLTTRYAWMIARGVAISALVLAIWRMHGRPLSALGLDLPVGDLGRIGLVLVGLCIAAVAFVVARSDRIASPARIHRLRQQATEIKILPRSNAELGWFLCVAVMAGIWEELLYRGFAIWFLLPYVGLVGAVAISTFVFAIGHLYQGWRGLLRSGGIGLAFAIWYVTTGSLWWLMGLHALIDVFGGLLAWRLLRIVARADAVIAG